MYSNRPSELEQELGANLDHVVESVMARERAVGGSASGARLDRQEGERESGGKCGLPTHAFLPKEREAERDQRGQRPLGFLGAFPLSRGNDMVTEVEVSEDLYLIVD